MIHDGKKVVLADVIANEPPIYKRCRIPKQNGQFRAIFKTDDEHEKATQRFALGIMTDYCEPLFSDRSYAYRPGRSAKNAIITVSCAMRKGCMYLVKLDVAKCFDSIPHAPLIRKIEQMSLPDEVKHFCRRSLNLNFVTRRGHIRKLGNSGIMQGMIIAPILCNIYLDTLDWWVSKNLPYIQYVRYADDILIMAKSKEEARKARQLIRSYIRESLKLKAPSEPVIGPSDGSIVYLGFDLSKQNNSAIGFEPSENAYNRLGTWLREVVEKGGDLPDDVVMQLRRKLQGWNNYYQADVVDILSYLPSCMIPMALEVMGG